jgi:membrane associated rhomboid family serine protease
MYDYRTSSEDEHQPMMWLRGYPVYAAHFLVAVFTGSLLVTSLAMLFNSSRLFDWLPFSSPLVLRGEVWRVFSYGLVNPPSLQFVIDMLMFVWFGREVERYFGRRKFLGLYACIYLITPVVFTVIGRWVPMVRIGETGSFALFVAFATAYPDALLMFNILAKWGALILTGLFTLMALAYHDTAGLISLWATCGFAYAFVRFHQGRFSLPSLRLWRRGPKLRLLPDLPSTRTQTDQTAKEDAQAEMDALLDKIARSGLASLTAKERAQLARARETLMKK